MVNDFGLTLHEWLRSWDSRTHVKSFSWLKHVSCALLDIGFFVCHSHRCFTQFKVDWDRCDYRIPESWRQRGNLFTLSWRSWCSQKINQRTRTLKLLFASRIVFINWNKPQDCGTKQWIVLCNIWNLLGVNVIHVGWSHSDFEFK